MCTSSAKRTFDIPSLFSSLCLMPKPFSFQVSTSLSIADWRTELKRRLLQKGSPCFVPRAIPNSSLSTSVSQYDSALISAQVFQEASELFTDRMVSGRSPDCFMLCRIKCLLQVDRCHPHVCLPLSAFLGYEFVRHEVVRCSECYSGSCLVGAPSVDRKAGCTAS